jgi:hypothetical protein
MPTATAGMIENPGSFPARRPAAAPRNSDGNTGPPRKPPSEILQARPLKAMSSASAESDHAAGSETLGRGRFPTQSSQRPPASPRATRSTESPRCSSPRRIRGPLHRVAARLQRPRPGQLVLEREPTTPTGRHLRTGPGPGARRKRRPGSGEPARGSPRGPTRPPRHRPRRAGARPRTPCSSA